jgi:ribonuclease I
LKKEVEQNKWKTMKVFFFWGGGAKGKNEYKEKRGKQQEHSSRNYILYGIWPTPDVGAIRRTPRQQKKKKTEKNLGR